MGTASSSPSRHYSIGSANSPPLTERRRLSSVEGALTNVPSRRQRVSVTSLSSMRSSFESPSKKLSRDSSLEQGSPSKKLSMCSLQDPARLSISSAVVIPARGSLDSGYSGSWRSSVSSARSRSRSSFEAYTRSRSSVDSNIISVIAGNSTGMEQIHEENEAISAAEQFALRHSRYVAVEAEKVARCVLRFGNYGGKESDKPNCNLGTFSKPHAIAVCQRSGDIIVGEWSSEIIQVFDARGDYKTSFEVGLVHGLSVLPDGNLVIASSKGVETYTKDGKKIEQVTPNLATSVASAPKCLITAEHSSVDIYGEDGRLLKRIRNSKLPSLISKVLHRHFALKRIVGVAIMPRDYSIVLLDAESRLLFVFSEKGRFSHAIVPAEEPCGDLKGPQGICVDSRNNIVVADTYNHRIVQFSPTGKYLGLVEQFLNNKQNAGGWYPHGVSCTNEGHLAVTVTGHNFAEVRLYRYK
ncbi:unnamed protein product [Dimorphilus gyrociliatus]|uniref:Uncharacterized protein n=1 Tax=Dimorphilus gyrociliatus TaxID=2664684 RepID=A0A7I8WCF8_9ANNE|nr:unnamed protein product [Dimorphilus gyrociliatus]